MEAAVLADCADCTDCGVTGLTDDAAVAGLAGVWADCTDWADGADWAVFAVFVVGEVDGVATEPAVTVVIEVPFCTAAGDGVAVACAQGIRYLERSDVAYVPIDEAPVLRWGLVRRTGPIPPLVAEFSQIAAELGPLTLALDLEPAGSTGRP